MITTKTIPANAFSVALFKGNDLCIYHDGREYIFPCNRIKKYADIGRLCDEIIQQSKKVSLAEFVPKEWNQSAPLIAFDNSIVSYWDTVLAVRDLFHTLDFRVYADMVCVASGYAESIENDFEAYLVYKEKYVSLCIGDGVIEIPDMGQYLDNNIGKYLDKSNTPVIQLDERKYLYSLFRGLLLDRSVFKGWINDGLVLPIFTSDITCLLEINGEIKECFDFDTDGVTFPTRSAQKTVSLDGGNLLICAKNNSAVIPIVDLFGYTPKSVSFYLDINPNGILSVYIQDVSNRLSQVRKWSLVEAKEKVFLSDNSQMTEPIDVQSSLTSLELEYFSELKACLEEDEEISSRERRLLNRLRDRLGISEARANELEESLKKPQLTEDEQEYYEEYKACLEDGKHVSEKDRRLLEKLRKLLGMTEKRAKEIENL